MTAPNPESFERALTKFKQSVSRKSPELVDQFSISTLHDVQKACIAIQDEMGPNACLRRMRRLKGFIEAMDQLGQSIEVFVNANDLVCFIWGPIKFLLNASRTYTESFDKLLDVYQNVGDAIPGLLAYQSMLEKHPPLATVLEDYYSDILRFHEAALAVFTRSRWKHFFKSAWKTFDTEFQPIIQSLSHRRELLESEKGSASLYEISKSREEIRALHEEVKHKLYRESLEKHQWRLLQIKDKLEASNYQRDQEVATEARAGSSSGTWMLKHPEFARWTNTTVSGHEVLYLHGIPGAGKTTLVSSVIASLLDQCSESNSDPSSLVVYFYIKHNQVGKDTHNDLLRAILDQIVTRDTVLSDHVFDQLATVEGVKVRSTKNLECLIITALEKYQTFFIVIDGLDEAAPGEAVKSLKWLLSLVDGGLKEPKASLRLLFSGQRDGILDDFLSGQPSIALELSLAHTTDIRKYCAHLGDLIREKFRISSEMENTIVEKVASQSNGMFLYARVVLDNLLCQTRLSRLKQEMQPGTFPDGLERAYERVVARVLQDSPTAEREDANKIIGWVACAERPLYWREIQSMFCIDAEAGTIDYDGDRLRVSCKHLCGSLVDVSHAEHGKSGPDDIVTMVHGTAREFLLKRRWVNITLQHAKAAAFCLRYLTSKPIRLDNQEDVLSHVKTGYYGFQDYAVQHCLNHLDRCLQPTSPDDDDVLRDTVDPLRDFLEVYCLSKPDNFASFSHSDIIEFFNQLPKDSRERASKFSIGYRTIEIRKHIEAIYRQSLSSPELETVNALYGGQVMYKCPKTWCDDFARGFEIEEDRTKHVRCHDRPFCCSEEGCFAFRFGFNTKEKLDNHLTEHHKCQGEIVSFPKTTSRVKYDSMARAAGRGDLIAVLAFLDSGESPDQDLIGIPSVTASMQHYNRLPLSKAAQKGHLSVCKLLLERGAILVHPAPNGGRTAICSPMNFAVHEGRLDIAHLFLGQPDFQELLPFECLQGWIDRACELGNLDMMKLLMESPAKGQVLRNRTSLWPTPSYMRIVCIKGFIDIAKYLLDSGHSAWVTPKAFFDAEYGGHADLANLLQPIVNLPALSRQRAEQLVLYRNVHVESLEPEQLLSIQNQPPKEQRAMVDKYRPQPLQDYQMQLLLLEKQNKRKLAKER